ncbi:MAG: hypothetical protein WCO23_03170 [bacterium]
MWKWPLIVMIVGSLVLAIVSMVYSANSWKEIEGKTYEISLSQEWAKKSTGSILHYDAVIRRADYFDCETLNASGQIVTALRVSFPWDQRVFDPIFQVRDDKIVVIGWNYDYSPVVFWLALILIVAMVVLVIFGFPAKGNSIPVSEM